MDPVDIELPGIETLSALVTVSGIIVLGVYIPKLLWDCCFRQSQEILAVLYEIKNEIADLKTSLDQLHGQNTFVFETEEEQEQEQDEGMSEQSEQSGQSGQSGQSEQSEISSEDVDEDADVADADVDVVLVTDVVLVADIVDVVFIFCLHPIIPAVIASKVKPLRPK